MRRDVPRILSARGAERLGISRSAIRHAVASGRWRALVRGVLLTVPVEPTRWDWAAAGFALAPPDAALSGWDALAVSGLTRGIDAPESVLFLTRTGNTRRLGTVTIRGRARPYSARILSGRDVPPGARVVPVARALADARLPVRSMRATVASAVQRGLCSPDEVCRELAAMGQRYSTALRKAAADVDAGARSIAEAESLDALRAVRVPPFEVNAPIATADGILVAIADLLWRELRYIIEIDSREYHFSVEDWERTRERHVRLTRLGYAVEHFPPSVIKADALGWATGVAAALEQRAAELISRDHKGLAAQAAGSL